MSEHQPSTGFEPSPPSQSRTGLWVALIGGAAACLILAIVVAAIGGLGWLAYDQVRTDNPTVQAGAVLAPPGWSSSLDDGFAYNQNDWLVGPQDNDNGHVELVIENGRYQWTVTAVSADGISCWVYPTFAHNLDDFYLSVDGHQPDGDSSNADYGLIFHVVDRDNLYFFAISDAQYMMVQLLQDGQWVTLLDWTESSLVNPGDVNQLAVLTERTHYKFYINGQLAHELDDDRLSGGTVGLGADVWDAEGATFEFDNFQVYEP